MSKPWITTPQNRLSAKYRALHAQLRREIAAPEPEPGKTARKRAASQSFHQRGE